MRNKPYLIKIASQKGGVGKTTIAVNLAVVLQSLGEDVLLVDFDIANPSVGFHLGITNYNLGVVDALIKDAQLENLIVPHSPTGLRVLPGNVTFRSNKTFINAAHIQKFMREIKNLKYSFIILDTAPGYIVPDFIIECDEAIIIATPELSASASSVRLSTEYKKYGIKSQLIVNRIKNKKYEMHASEIEEAFGSRAIGLIPEDESVPESIAMHIPGYLRSRYSLFSKSIFEIGRFYGSNTNKLENNFKRKGFIWFLKKILRIN